MTDHLSTTRNVPIAKVFEYYSNFEKYPERYKLYCQRLDAKQTGNTMTTDEMWNISLGNDISHVKIKVRYILIPNNTIQYEILEGWGAGTKNQMRFTEAGNNTFVALNFVPIDILLKFYPVSDQMITKLITYFADRDVLYLEEKPTLSQAGDLCSYCKEGHLEPRTVNIHGNQNRQGNESRNFRCDKCGKETGFIKINAGHPVHVSTSISALDPNDVES